MESFTYQDTDSPQNELSELYSYGEESEFFANRNAFEESMEDCGLPLAWKHMVQEQQTRAINYLMTTLEVSCRSTRIKSCRALAYLIQGTFGECLTIEEQLENCRENVFLLYEQGIFQAFVQQLLIESDLNLISTSQSHNFNPSRAYFDSSELRLILSVLCTITEIMYHAKDSADLKVQALRSQFVTELQYHYGDEYLTIILFQMLNNFCGGSAPHYPIRKITLLLWKIILITLGGTEELRNLKRNSREAGGLQPAIDDTLDVARNMRPCSPPVLPDGQAKARTAISGSGGFMANKRKVFKQPAFDDAVFAYAKECLLNSLAEFQQTDEGESSEENNEFQPELNDSSENIPGNTDTNNDIDLYITSNIDDSLSVPKSLESENLALDSGVATDSDCSSSEKTITGQLEDLPGSTSNREVSGDGDSPDDIHDPPPVETMPPPPSTSLRANLHDNVAHASRFDPNSSFKGLPWAPKVRKADLEQHLSNLRNKFLGYTLPDDLETTFGLPDPIVEGVNVIRRHLYISLSEVQLEREGAIEKYPLTHKELNLDYQEAPAEKLYQALLPRLPQYMIALLKILLASSTSSKTKTERSESINIMNEMNLDADTQSIIQSMKMNADANRHKEIIIKAVSAILLLLLKHFKVNHIYQFEYVSQQLMFANCIPLILKFLSQDIYSYIVSSKSTISVIDFPACVIGEQPELTTEAIELWSFQPYCWRNMFSCINLVRVLNKLTKWKHSRIMMLVVFKSAPTLAKALSVRHPVFQVYVLKLLKVQLKFLGRQWKKTNMKLISAIYQKVRHRLTDDWAYSNDNEARPWDFQAEEFTLQANINKFHQRRYHSLLNAGVKSRSNSAFNQIDRFDDAADEDYDFDLETLDQISPHFERNYEKWLENEVFQRRVDWDRLLND